jgi:hypothetical protein
MNNDISTPAPYRTSDTPYAAYLYYSGHKPVIMRPDPNDYKRLVFVFVEHPDIPKLEDDYKNGTPIVELKKYYKSYKIVTRMVNEAKQ